MNGILLPLLLVGATLTAPEIEGAVEQSRIRIREVHRESAAPGVQTAVALDGDLVWTEGFGWRDLELRLPVDEQTRFGIGSITKTMTMAVCARLADRAHLAWDEPIESCFDGFPHEGAGITVRRIGAHLSGMGDGT